MTQVQVILPLDWDAAPRDAAKKKRKRRGVLSKAGSATGNKKVSNQTVGEIRWLREKEGWPVRRIAERLGLPVKYTSHVCLGYYRPAIDRIRPPWL